MRTFVDAFKVVVGAEGKLSMDPNDGGNWTGGAPQKGELKGTKYGVSAARYPTLDIKNLTIDQASTIAKKDYWDNVQGDSLPYGTALLIFDEAYNAGPHEAIVCAQKTLGLVVDGYLGPNTLTALQGTGGVLPAFAAAFTANRIMAYTQMRLWPNDGVGWTGRACFTMAMALV